VELQRRYRDLTKRGLGLIAVSYDSTEILKKFADSRGITFPMVSDPGSRIIKEYGLLNETVDPNTRSYGIPHPGTFMLNKNGVVTSRYFEDAYQERNTVASILARQGGTTSFGSAQPTETMHLTVSASVSDAEVAPGKRISVAFDVVPKRKMHVYAPGKHDYQVITVVLDPQPWLKVQPMIYPRSEIYDFKPLNERVEVYSKPFTLVQDVTILATPDAQKLLSGLATIALSGRVSYQACNDTVCFTPASVPFAFTLSVTPLDRRPPGG
jgi:AhpC/TSA family